MSFPLATFFIFYDITTLAILVDVWNKFRGKLYLKGKCTTDCHKCAEKREFQVIFSNHKQPVSALHEKECNCQGVPVLQEK